MSNIVITGSKSNIAAEFIKLVPEKDSIEKIKIKDLSPAYYYSNLFLFCNGLLRSKPSSKQTEKEIHTSLYVNYSSIAFNVAKIIDCNPYARICIIGSESVYKGSFDDTYVFAKKLLHNFIVNYPLNTKNQQLVGISPGIIADTGMTTRRKDTNNLLKRKTSHPMKRFVTSREVAKLCYTLLYEQPYINRTIIRMHGGEI